MFTTSTWPEKNKKHNILFIIVCEWITKKNIFLVIDSNMII